MKRLMCMLAVLGTTLWLGSTARAEFHGALNRGEVWTLNVDNTGGFDPGTAITVHYVRGKREVIVVRTVPGQERAEFTFPAPLLNDVRIVIEVDPSALSTTELDVVQGDLRFGWTSNGFSRAVFDVADATS